MNLRTLTDEEFLRHALAVQDPLTSSAIEAECLRRFEALLDTHDSEAYELVTERELDASVLRDTLDTLDAHDIEPGALAQLCDAMLIGPANTAALLNALAAADLDAPESLKAELDLAKQFRALVEDAGDVFSRLSELTTTANKE